MEEKINCILLVDDSKSTNFYNKKLIEITKMTNHIHDVGDGIEALEYLTRKGKFDIANSEVIYPRPNIIFLDINMPRMDGFEFLDAYIELPEALRSDMIVTFLTTSNWQKDKLKAYHNCNFIYDFIEKPLSKEKLFDVYTFYRDHYYPLRTAQ